MLRIFEMVSGLRVNFHKSCLVGLNVDDEELSVASQFLYCKIGKVPFNFLGIPIGANPRLMVTWNPIIKRLWDRFSTWRSKQLSIGERITLINSVLASLPLYYFSFFRAPKKVIKELVKIQRNFLWGGRDDVRKMAWVRWSRVCLLKKLGGLGIRSMEFFNISLLGKWKWRLLTDEESVWFGLTKKLYGGNGILSRKQLSTWWKDLEALDDNNSPDGNWFKDCVRLKFGNGERARFWTDTWCNNCSLAELFPHLYELSARQQGAAAEFGYWVDGCWVWRLEWKRELTEAEAADAELLETTVRQIQPGNNMKDSWKWILDSSNSYCVKSVYSLLINKSEEHWLEEDQRKIITNLWHTAAPSKYLVHAWRVLLDKLPTRVALQQRGVVPFQSGPVCVFCRSCDVDCDHLFFHCGIAEQIWNCLR